MTTDKGQPAGQAKGNEQASLRGAQPKKPSQPEQTRTALENAKSARLSQGAITSLEQEVEKPVVLNAKARAIGAQIDVGKSSQGRRSTEGTLARARGARTNRKKFLHR